MRLSLPSPAPTDFAIGMSGGLIWGVAPPLELLEPSPLLLLLSSPHAATPNSAAHSMTATHRVLVFMHPPPRSRTRARGSIRLARPVLLSRGPRPQTRFRGSAVPPEAHRRRRAPRGTG